MTTIKDFQYMEMNKLIRCHSDALVLPLEKKYVVPLEKRTNTQNYNL